MNNFIKHKYILLPLLAFISTVAMGQNINTPNKIGPLGTQVNTASGNLYIPRNDVYIPSRGFDINLTFYYNAFFFDTTMGFGKGWTCSYGIQYKNDAANGKTIFWGDGREEAYKFNGGNYIAPKGFFNTLTQYQPNKYLLTQLDGTQYYFDNATHKKITKLIEPNGNFINFLYTDSLLTTITNTAGQSITLTYNTNGSLATVVDAITTPTRTYSYTYNTNGNLTQVTDPIGGSNKYTYLTNGPMKTMSDKNNNTIDIIYYNDYTVSEIVGCNKRQNFSYDTVSRVTVVTDYLANGNNQTTKYEFKKFEDFIWLTKKTGNCCGYNMTFEFDDVGNIIKQTDANANTTLFTYDNKGNVLSTTDALGQKMFYTYSNTYYDVLTSTDAMGNTSTMTYDSRGNLIQMLEPTGLTTNITYNALGDVLSITDPRGNTTTFTYDTYGNLLTANAPLGIVISFVNDARGNVLSSTDPRGFTNSATYDLLDRLLTTTDPYGHTNQLTYDAEDNLITSKNENGQINSFAYDASNRLVKITNALGNKNYFTYDAMDNLIKAVDALGNTSLLYYDNLNRLTSIKDAVGDITSFSYDGNGNMTNSLTAMGRSITNTFDKLDRLIKSEDNNGILGTMEYDKNGNVIKTTNATGAITTYSYDVLDRLKKITDPLGNSSSYIYDNNSNVLSNTDRNGNTVNYVYDVLNRNTSTIDNNGFVTSVTYDASSNVTAVTDENNRTTNYVYDNLDRLTKTTYPDTKFLQYTYDNIGNLINKKLTDGNNISFVYDSLNRMTAKILPNSNNFTYQYDALNRMVAAINNTATVNMTYDALSRLTSESLNGKTTRYNYNVAQRLQTTLYPDSTSIVKAFDTRGRLSSIAKNNNNIASYQYNNANQIIAKTFANGITTNIQYDAANRLSNITTGAIQNSSYIFDKEWNKKSIVRNNIPTNSEEYSYDAGYRLTNAKKGAIGGPTTVNNTYSYDAVGNRTAANFTGVNTNYTSNNLNQLTNSNNGTQNINFTYDDNGNLTYDGSFYKTYDAEGKILKDSASPTNKIIYSYDAFGRRTQKNVNGNLLNYVYAGLKQIELRDGNTDTLLNRTVFGSFLAPIYSEKNNEKYYYHQNELNSVEAITNTNGNLVERYDYDVYGKQTIYDNNNTTQTNSLASNRFGFTGQEYDKETGNNHFHYRQYSSKTGTFNQRDPIGYDDGMGMYQYVGNSPTNKIDLMGLRGRTPATSPSMGTPSSWEGPSSDPGFTQFLQKLYKAGKNTKDVQSTVNGMTELALHYSESEMTAYEQKLISIVKSTQLAKVSGLLKSVFLIDKLRKLKNELFKNCRDWKKIGVLSTEAAISSASLWGTLQKLGARKLLSAGSTRLLGIIGLLDVSSYLTTKKSLITNVVDLPSNLYEIGKNIKYTPIVIKNGAIDFKDGMHQAGVNWKTNFLEGAARNPYFHDRN
jgi:RHS repeat-associated protein